MKNSIALPAALIEQTKRLEIVIWSYNPEKYGKESFFFAQYKREFEAEFSSLEALQAFIDKCEDKGFKNKEKNWKDAYWETQDAKRRKRIFG